MTIVSFSRRFIFIKTTKTAGSSLEVHLARLCGPDDIVTPIMPPNPTHQPRNYEGGYFNHMSAESLRALQPDAFGRFYKFCFERHPVDKCISHFAMLKNSPHHRQANGPANWEAYLDQGTFPIDVAKYGSENGNLLVDKIYRYEDMSSALEDLETRLEGVLRPFTVREKSGFRHDTPTFAEVMENARQKARIMSAFSASLRLTPYD